MRQTGLTLLELIVVMTIIATILLVVGLPVLGHGRTSLTTLGRRTATLVRLARTTAITHSVTEYIKIDPRTRIIALMGQLTARQLHIRALRVPRSVRVSVSANTPYGPHGTRLFLFYPDGSASPGVIVFHHQSRKRAVTVGLFSHAR